MPITEIPKQIPRPSVISTVPDVAAIMRERRKLRRRWFLLAETLSVAVMIGSVVAGISERFAAESLTPLFRLLPIAAALAAAILPIIYFSNPNRRLR